MHPAVFFTLRFIACAHCKTEASYLLGPQHIADKHVAELDIFQVTACSLGLPQPDLRQG